jgi:indolepyruvate ferredoxin oxidoreductase
LTSESLYRALELFGRNVAMNKRTFDWGRYTAADPASVLALAQGSEPRVEPKSIEELIDRRAAFLVDYQNEALAARYRGRVEKIMAREREVSPGSVDLSFAAAKSYFKLLSYKDEYEVARLHTSGDFLPDLRRHFGDGFKLRFHFSPPIFAPVDPETGRTRKYEFGGWMLPVLRLLAKFKFLRGTAWDPFGRSKERRVERELIAEYEELMDAIAAELNPAKLDLAVEILSAAESIRGYGPIKDESIAKYRERLARLRVRWETAVQRRGAETKQATAA